eukprot:Skav224273  [mRNA]  locus=scaffold217:45328:46902:+ [translate_table: standard]
MERQIRASQRFLTGLRALARFDEIRAQQFDAVLATISRAGLVSAQVGAETLEAMDHTLWTPVQVQAMQEAVSEKMQGEQRERRPLQDFTQLPGFLDASMWTRLQSCSSVEQKVQSLTHLCGKLGLRCATEGTYAAIVWLAAFAFPSGEQDQFQCLQKHKPWMKKYLQGLPELSVYPVFLPADTASLLPAVMSAAYPEGFQPPSLPAGLDILEIENYIRLFPLRKTNLHVVRSESTVWKPDSVGSVVPQLMEGFGKIVNGLARGRGSPAKGQSESLARSAQVVAAPLALMDKPSGPETAQAAGVSTAAVMSADVTPGDTTGAACAAEEPDSLTSELDALRKDCGQPTHETEETSGATDDEPPVYRRPSKRVRGKSAGVTSMKRPAAAVVKDHKKAAETDIPAKKTKVKKSIHSESADTEVPPNKKAVKVQVEEAAVSADTALGADDKTRSAKKDTAFNKKQSGTVHGTVPTSQTLSALSATTHCLRTRPCRWHQRRMPRLRARQCLGTGNACGYETTEKEKQEQG